MVHDAVWLNPWARISYDLLPREEYKKMQDKQLDEMFTYHAPKGNQQERYQYLRKQAKRLAEAVVALCPPSREQSIALTKIQEASMMANAAIAINEKETFPVMGVAFMGSENGDPLTHGPKVLGPPNNALAPAPSPEVNTLPPSPERPVEPEAPEEVDPALLKNDSLSPADKFDPRSPVDERGDGRHG